MMFLFISCLATLFAFSSAQSPGSIKMCQLSRDCDVDEHCAKGLLCADEHKGALTEAGFDPRKANCTKMMLMSTNEVCFAPSILDKKYKVTVTSLAYRQPFGPFFVLTHNDKLVEPLFVVGTPASSALGVLAEEGSPADLVTKYTGAVGVGSAAAVTNGQSPPLLDLGEKFSFNLTVPYMYPYVSMASMAVNTNDCFAGINSMMVNDGLVIMSPGYDSGTEINNEECEYIPGPACAAVAKLPPAGNGEGFIHVHRGVHGIADLADNVYDWRNPMLRLKFEMYA